MDNSLIYEIRVKGIITERWSDWFDGLAIHNEPDGVSVLTGRISDQAALFGVLGKLQALNLTLISIIRKPPG